MEKANTSAIIKAESLIKEDSEHAKPHSIGNGPHRRKRFDQTINRLCRAFGFLPDYSHASEPKQHTYEV